MKVLKPDFSDRDYDERIYIKIQTTQNPFSDANGHQIFHIAAEKLKVSIDGKDWFDCLEYLLEGYSSSRSKSDSIV